MKKIVGIIAALALASAVFADAPDVTPSVSSFDGSASIEYDIDLNDPAFGIVNLSTTEFKIQFCSAGDKATEGDGLWGDLKIKISDAVTVASGGTFTVPSVSIDHAKIHFVEGDFYANMDITCPSFSVGGGDIITSTWSAKAFPSASVSLKATDPAKVGGFTLNFGLDGLVDFNLKFADNGVVKADAKKFAFGFDVTLKAVENLTFVAGVAYSTQTEKLAAAVKTDYKLGLTDALYLKPAVGFAYQGEEVKDADGKVTQPADYKLINAGFLLGWGTEGQEPGFAAFNGTKAGAAATWDNVPNKCADGFSVFAGVPLVDEAAIELLVSAYDATLVSGLKIGAQLWSKNVSKFSDSFWAADFAAKYSTTVADDWAISANFGFEAENLDKADKSGKEVKKGFLFGCGIENGAIIDNTTLYLNYAGQFAKDLQKSDGTVVGKDDKGTIKIGAKIHF